jgi:hypothetical protein
MPDATDPFASTFDVMALLAKIGYPARVTGNAERHDLDKRHPAFIRPFPAILKQPEDSVALLGFDAHRTVLSAKNGELRKTVSSK